MVTSPGQAKLATSIPFTYVLVDPVILEAWTYCLDFLLVITNSSNKLLYGLLPHAVVMLAHKCN
jgi:hypothetical protein